MINESQTNHSLNQLNEKQKKELALHLNKITSQKSYSAETINRYIKIRIPNKLLQPIKRWLLNNLSVKEIKTITGK